MYKFYNRLNNEIINIRKTVFIEEQGFENEFDEIDDGCKHIIYYYGNKPVGTARMFEDEENKNEYFIGRVAILKEYRKYGLGKKIILAIEEKALEIKARKLKLSTQVEVKGFYEKCGYKPIGEIYYDEYCPHIMMEKTL